MAGAFGSNRGLKLRLIHGTFDDIPLEATAEFAAMLTEAGYDVQLSEFAGGHVEPPRDLYLTTIRTVLVP